MSDIVIGITRPLAAPVGSVVRRLSDEMTDQGYFVKEISVSSLLGTVVPLGSARPVPPKDYFDDLTDKMAAGDRLRADLSHDAAAALAIRQIVLTKNGMAARSNHRPWCFIVSSLMHPAEVSLMRAVYSERFFLIAVAAPEYERREHLKDRLSSSSLTPLERDYYAELLLRRDRGGARWERLLFDVPLLGDPKVPADAKMTVENTFARADFYVRISTNTSGADLEDQITRFSRLLLDAPHLHPTEDEAAMAIALSTGLRSSALGRQVGAVLVSATGGVLALGWNEVPAPGGGLYPTVKAAEVVSDVRDFLVGEDVSDKVRTALFHDLVLRIMSNEEWMAKFVSTILHDRLDNAVISPEEMTAALRRLESDDNRHRSPLLALIDEILASRRVWSSQFFDTQEYGRVAHAEMAAICDAARRGIPTDGSSLYVTTFPCHECTRHVIAAGVRRVVYIEPYPKSRAAELHGDAIHIVDEDEPWDEKVERLQSEHTHATNDEAVYTDAPVIFEPFVGAAPRQYRQGFEMLARKVTFHDLARGRSLEDVGDALQWEGDVQGTGDPVLRSVAKGGAPLLLGLHELTQLEQVATRERLVVRNLIEAANKAGFFLDEEAYGQEVSLF